MSYGSVKNAQTTTVLTLPHDSLPHRDIGQTPRISYGPVKNAQTKVTDYHQPHFTTEQSPFPPAIGLQGPSGKLFSSKDTEKPCRCSSIRGDVEVEYVRDDGDVC